jgi:cell division protein FtsI (penicillin-binding protein 3)
MHAPIHLEGVSQANDKIVGRRIGIIVLLLICGLLIVVVQLLQLGSFQIDDTIEGVTRDVIQASRPPVVDRNGIAIALDVRVPSLFADPRRVIDVETTASALLSVLPELDPVWLRGRLGADKGFVWIRRELTPAKREEVMALGLPGIDFIEESKRFYPGGPELAHVIGSVNVDNQGTSGMELAIDRSELAVLQELGYARGAELAPKTLSVDTRVQYVMRSELRAALDRFSAIAAGGVLLDIRTGEVIALVSLPDFDPNDPATSLRSDSLNRITNGTFELGSTFKTMTIAAALESEAVEITDLIDAREGVRFGRFTLDHGRHEILSVSDIFRYSDNIGTIRIMQAMGGDALRKFLKVAGFDQRSTIELPERAMPRVPDAFSEVGAATASYGYGFAATPMHMISAVAALMNGGNYAPPTLFKRTEAESRVLYRPIVGPETSGEMAYLFRMNALLGSGRRMDAEADGYRAGGKTGTAEKVIAGRYSKTKNITVFTAAFPMDSPRYAMLVLLDEPQAENAQSTREAGWNVAVVSGQIIARIAPMLRVAPNNDPAVDTRLMAIGR